MANCCTCLDRDKNKTQEFTITIDITFSLNNFITIILNKELKNTKLIKNPSINKRSVFENKNVEKPGRLLNIFTNNKSFNCPNQYPKIPARIRLEKKIAKNFRIIFMNFSKLTPFFCSPTGTGSLQSALRFSFKY